MVGIEKISKIVSEEDQKSGFRNTGLNIKVLQNKKTKNHLSLKKHIVDKLLIATK